MLQVPFVYRVILESFLGLVYRVSVPLSEFSCWVHRNLIWVYGVLKVLYPFQSIDHLISRFRLKEIWLYLWDYREWIYACVTTHEVVIYRQIDTQSLHPLVFEYHLLMSSAFLTKYLFGLIMLVYLVLRDWQCFRHPLL